MTFPDFSNNRLSSVVTQQPADFIKENYQNFISFIQAYFEFMEQTGEATNVLKNIPNYINPDYVVENSLTQFIEQFQQNYLNTIPTYVLADKAKLLKHIKDYYTSRGTPKSYEFLFRILYNEDVHVFNTGSQILKVSDGKWYQPLTLRIATSVNSLSDFDGITITGNQSFSSAVVESVNLTLIDGVNYDELTLSNITKQFINGETITGISLTGNIVSATVLGIVSAINIINPGAKYNVGDYVPIISTVGTGANAQISSVSPGSISAILITDGGAGFQTFPDWTISTNNSLKPLNIKIIDVDSSGILWPNTYIFNDNIITNSLGTVINTISSGIISSVFPTYITYANVGSILALQIIDGGEFADQPQLNVNQNVVIGNAQTQVVNYGTIGTLKIVNGGINYVTNESVIFTDATARGYGAAAHISSVNANGSITSVAWELPSITGTANVVSGSNVVIGKGTSFTTQLIANDNITIPNSGTYIIINNEHHRVANITNNTLLKVDANYSATQTTNKIYLDGYILGGYGYSSADFNNGINITINTANGTGGIIKPDSILGSGEIFNTIGDVYGKIQAFVLNNFGNGYSTNIPVTINLTELGDGTATANAIVLGGLFSYPGRYLNEDGMVSGRRYIENANTYNFYSYSLTSPVPVTLYKDLVYNIIHPAGMNMIGITSVDIPTQSLNLNNNDITVYVDFVPARTLLDVTFFLDISTLS